MVRTSRRRARSSPLLGRLGLLGLLGVPHVLALFALVPLTSLLGCKSPPSAGMETTSADKEKNEKGEKDEKNEKTAKRENVEKNDEHDRRADHDKGDSRDGAAGKDGAIASDAKRAFGVPFIDSEDPLALTRDFFREVAADNRIYMSKHEPLFFKSFAATQKPRATVISCADSRVQSSAFDATAENDDFFVRNMGNQIANAEGSVEYGVRHLHTPVLFVLGHTGCGAVKAAMNGYGDESESIRHELDAMHVPASKEDAHVDDAKVWLAAVIDNVNDQVAAALEKFHDEMTHNTLTVVGAVYDFRNDMRMGAGKVVILNVNGVTDPPRVSAFVRSVSGDEEVVAAVPAKHGHEHDAGDLHDHALPVPALASLSELRDVLANIPGARAAHDEKAHAHNAHDEKAHDEKAHDEKAHAQQDAE